MSNPSVTTAASGTAIRDRIMSPPLGDVESRLRDLVTGQSLGDDELFSTSGVGRDRDLHRREAVAVDRHVFQDGRPVSGVVEGDLDLFAGREAPEEERNRGPGRPGLRVQRPDGTTWVQGPV